MKFRGTAALAAVSCLGMAACHFPGLPGGNKPPTGQVVATVDGKEITRLELEAELNGVNTADPKIRKAAEQQALQMIVARTILADEARKQQLDKTPDFALQQQRATDTLLAQSLQNKMITAVPAPSDDEAQRFITDNPDVFAQRKIFAVDTIRMARPTDLSLVKGLEPLKTLPDVDAYLTAHNIEHSRTSGNIDAVGADPRLIGQIVKLPPNEIFLFPGPNGVLLVNQIRDVKIVPFQGPDATKYATAVLKKQRTQQAVSNQMRQIVQADAKQVQYNEAYKPAPQAAPAAPKPAG